MENIKDNFRIYLSHCIRGKNGINATQKEINDNIEFHKKVGEEIKAYLIDWEKMDGLPKVELYVPAEHDEFVKIAYDKKYITEEQILDVDCEIINTCKMIILFGNYISRGMKVEYEHAHKFGIPVFEMHSLNKVWVGALKNLIITIQEQEDD